MVNLLTKSSACRKYMRIRDVKLFTPRTLWPAAIRISNNSRICMCWCIYNSRHVRLQHDTCENLFALQKRTETSVKLSLFHCNCRLATRRCRRAAEQRTRIAVIFLLFTSMKHLKMSLLLLQHSHFRSIYEHKQYCRKLAPRAIRSML